MTDPVTIALRAREAVRLHSGSTERSAQQEAHLIGGSEIGLCRSYLVFMLRQTPYDERDDDKFAAFVGSAVGERVESAYADTFANVSTQVHVQATLPSGAIVRGNPDIVDIGENCVVDVKTKDGLAVVSYGNLDRAHKYQVAIYLLGLVQAGILKEGAQAFLAYFDRSGADSATYVVEVVVDDALIEEIDDWVGDALYAHLHNEEAPRDKPFDWCVRFCPFFSTCRGDSIVASSVIEDEETTLAAKMYLETSEEIKSLEKRKEQAKAALVGREGAIPSLGVSLHWTHVNPGDPYTVTPRGYDKIQFRNLT